MVYDLKDDVNRKLIKQEAQLRKKLKGGHKSAKPNKPSPPFKKVLQKILAMRATTCSSSSGR